MSECCICLEEFNDNSWTTGCGHMMHLKCAQNQYRATCPLCRSGLDITLTKKMDTDLSYVELETESDPFEHFVNTSLLDYRARQRRIDREAQLRELSRSTDAVFRGLETRREAQLRELLRSINAVSRDLAPRDATRDAISVPYTNTTFSDGWHLRNTVPRNIPMYMQVARNGQEILNNLASNLIRFVDVTYQGYTTRYEPRQGNNLIQTSTSKNTPATQKMIGYSNMIGVVNDE